MTETTYPGQAVALVSLWYASVGGPAADVTNLTITITPVAGGAAVISASTAWTHPATGVYVYEWTPSVATPAGNYLALWSAGGGLTASEIVTVLATASAGGIQTAQVSYCTREDVQRALDVKETARSAWQIDNAITAATGTIEGLTHRKFYPMTAVRYFNWPNQQYARPWRLWLDADELIAVSSLTSGDVEIDSDDYHLEPVNSGPPYTSIEIVLSSSATFGGGSTHQRQVAISGVFGHSAAETPGGSSAEALDTTETAVDVTDSALIGVGSIIRVDSERMIVTNKTMITSGQTLGAPGLTALANNVTVAVTTGTAYHVDETILIDSERMLIVDIAGNNLTVKRQWDGSVLAAHTAGATIYVPRTLTVQRGALGTTAASHITASSISVHVVPSLIRELAVAEAVNTLIQRTSGYARTSGSGEYQRETSGRGLRQIRDDVLTRYARKARSRAV
jgi:hypothetical protein